MPEQAGESSTGSRKLRPCHHRRSNHASPSPELAPAAHWRSSPMNPFLVAAAASEAPARIHVAGSHWRSGPVWGEPRRLEPHHSWWGLDRWLGSYRRSIPMILESTAGIPRRWRSAVYSTLGSSPGSGGWNFSGCSFSITGWTTRRPRPRCRCLGCAS